MTLEKAKKLLAVQADFGGFYNANGAKLILAEVQREHGQAAVDALIGFIHDRRLRTDVLFIRAQSTIRADGTPSAQARSLQPEPCSPCLRAARANRVFCTDEKRIRTENTVMDKNKDSAGVLFEIADWARMCFSSVPDR